MTLSKVLKNTMYVLRSILLNDFVILLVIIVVLYVNARYTKLENENLLNSVQTFVFKSLNEIRMESALQLSNINKQQQQGMRNHNDVSGTVPEYPVSSSSSPSVAAKGLTASPPATPARAGAERGWISSGERVIGENYSTNDNIMSSRAEAEEDEDVNDEIRYLFRCISSGEKYTKTDDKNANNRVSIVELEEERENEKESDHGGFPAIEQENEEQDTSAGNQENEHGVEEENAAKKEENVQVNEKENERNQETSTSTGTSDELVKMKVSELKKVAQNVGVDPKGTKDAIIKRIQSRQNMYTRESEL